ncbi:hypothetical protein [Streptomyces sp. NPDC002851]
MTPNPTRARTTPRLLLAAMTLTALITVPAAAASQEPPRSPRTDGAAAEDSAASRSQQPAPAAESRTAAGTSASTAAERSAASSEAPDENPPPVYGGPGSVYERVAHFYAAYIDVANDPGDNTVAGELRKFYLTPELRKRLLKWEHQNEADGVLRAQNVPSAWKVTAGDSGMGHTWSTVRLTWGTGEDRWYSYLEVQSDLSTRKISGIKSKY